MVIFHIKFISSFGGFKLQQIYYFLISTYAVRGTKYWSIDVKSYGLMLWSSRIICVLDSVAPHFSCADLTDILMSMHTEHLNDITELLQNIRVGTMASTFPVHIKSHWTNILWTLARLCEEILLQPLRIEFPLHPRTILFCKTLTIYISHFLRPVHYNKGKGIVPVSMLHFPSTPPLLPPPLVSLL